MTTREASPEPLTEAQLERLERDGFVRVPSVFSGAEVERMREAFCRLERLAHRLGRTCDYRGSRFVVERLFVGRGQPRVRIHRIVWCGGAEATLERFGSDARLVRMAAQVLGSPVVVQLIQQAHFKLPGDGVAFPWHQDSSHRRYGTEWRDVNGRGSFVQTVTALDPIGEDNGPLRFIPGSHRWGHLALPADGTLPPPLDPAQAVTVAMEPGDVVVFGPYVVHGSPANDSDRPRRTFVNGFAYPGANRRCYPGCGTGRVLRVW